MNEKNSDFADSHNWNEVTCKAWKAETMYIKNIFWYKPGRLCKRTKEEEY